MCLTKIPTESMSKLFSIYMHCYMRFFVVKINTLPWFLNFGIEAISKPFRNQGQCVYFYDLKTHVKCAVLELAIVTTYSIITCLMTFFPDGGQPIGSKS